MTHKYLEADNNRVFSDPCFVQEEGKMLINFRILSYICLCYIYYILHVYTLYSYVYKVYNDIITY